MPGTIQEEIPPLTEVLKTAEQGQPALPLLGVHGPTFRAAMPEHVRR